MGILSNIFHKIFPESHPAVTAPAPGAAATPVSATPAATVAAPAGPAEPALAKENNAIDEVDVEAILDKAAKQAGQPLNWRTSIVDLLKALQLDSSLDARKSLAQELHYFAGNGATSLLLASSAGYGFIARLTDRFQT